MNGHHYIILPTYNEFANIEKIIRNIFSIAPHTHILVVDDNSPDGTARVVRELMKEFTNLSLEVRNTKDGLGRAYIHGFRKVLNDPHAVSITMMDSDLSHDPKYIPEHYRLIKDTDVVIGSRYTDGGGVSGWELWRRILSRCGNFYARTITRIPVNDLTGGFNTISISMVRSIDFASIASSGYAFLIELKYLLYKKGARFVEFPIIFKNREGGESKISNHIIGEGIIAPWKMVFKNRKK